MQPLLSDLCSICHRNTPKYRCPACSTRTCSLECVQTHKARGCSGKRDPTSYVKKSQLATPSGVDHDYNFISGIERSRGRAEDHLQGRSIHDAEGRSTRLNQPAFRNRLQLARVNVEYAPLGMSRQKLNKTRLTQSKRIHWTVEWIHEDHSSSIGSIFDDEEIHKAYRSLLERQTGGGRAKRKRDNGNATTPETLNLDQDIRTSIAANPVNEKEHIETSPLKRDHEGTSSKEPLSTEAIDDTALDTILPEAAAAGGSSISDAPPPKEPGLEDSAIKAKLMEQQMQPEPPSKSSDDQDLHYYLVKPRTTSAEKVLIPLSPTDTFLTCLQNQTVLEFPTIQVLSCGTDALPAGFVTESEYLARYKQEAHEMQELIKEDGEVEEPESGLKAGHQSVTPQSHTNVTVDDAAMPNPSTLLATLERDMRTD